MPDLVSERIVIEDGPHRFAVLSLNEWLALLNTAPELIRMYVGAPCVEVGMVERLWPEKH